MSNFAIITDSSSDLTFDLREKYQIDYAPMHVICEGRDYVADLDFKEISYTDFYGLMRNGKRITTAQVNALDYKAMFEKYLSEGKDVLSISCSSALSASVKASYAVRDELSEKYPDRKIICVDSLNSCWGLGTMCMTAADMRNEGKSIDEVAAWLEEHKLEMNQEATVEKLSYLRQAGRVSAAKAFFGGIMNVKPIIISDAVGHNYAIEKAKGRAASMTRLAERMKAEYCDYPYQRVTVAHADCEEAAMELKAVIENVFGDSKPEIVIGKIGPIIGASVGPGTVAIYFYGKKVEAVGE